MGIAGNLENQRFGRLLVVSRHGRTKGRNITWLCQCDCGSTSIVSTAHLNQGATNSCGCLRRERSRIVARTHGASYSREYKSWAKAKERCSNKNHVAFHVYGGAGIFMCDKWKNSFEAFYADMGDAPAGHTLDRIENFKGYEPGNCRWATPKQQSQNSRSPRLLTFRGITKNLSDWSRDLGMDINAVRQRMDVRGWSIERALTERPKAKRPTKLSPS